MVSQTPECSIMSNIWRSRQAMILGLGGPRSKTSDFESTRKKDEYHCLPAVFRGGPPAKMASDLDGLLEKLTSQAARA